MTLLEYAMETVTMIDRTTAPDGYGGVVTVWVDGASFPAAITLSNSIEARLAAVQGVTSLYTVITSRAINLQYHDVIRRQSDGKVFRITSNGDDNKTPEPASLDMRQVTAEEWRLPNG